MVTAGVDALPRTVNGTLCAAGAAAAGGEAGDHGSARGRLLRSSRIATTPTRTPWIAAVALATDVADGRIARATEPTAFALHHEPSRTLRAAAVTAWAFPVCAVTAAYVAGGRSVDYPRPVVLRNASVALQVLVTARALRRRSTAP